MIEHKYFLYARKSTDEDDGSTMLTMGLVEGSIESQLTELREFAHKERTDTAVRGWD